MKDPLQMSVDDIRKFAIQTNDPILHRRLHIYEFGNASWDQILQLAVISLSEQCAHYRNELNKCKAEQC